MGAQGNRPQPGEDDKRNPQPSPEPDPQVRGRISQRAVLLGSTQFREARQASQNVPTPI